MVRSTPPRSRWCTPHPPLLSPPFLSPPPPHTPSQSLDYLFTCYHPLIDTSPAALYPPDEAEVKGKSFLEVRSLLHARIRWRVAVALRAAVLPGVVRSEWVLAVSIAFTHIRIFPPHHPRTTFLAPPFRRQISSVALAASISSTQPALPPFPWLLLHRSRRLGFTSLSAYGPKVSSSPSCRFPISASSGCTTPKAASACPTRSSIGTGYGHSV